MIMNVNYTNIRLNTNKKKERKHKVCINMIARINPLNERIKHSFKPGQDVEI